ncbi:MAG TPA: hypothetical protein VJ960_03705 [Oceanipulchritudo sp.]|nr:hypothetical protein [Oceanipulchritudo sp.]
MIFWDSSSVLPLLVTEDCSGAAVELLRADPDMAIWWGTRVECVSALARLEREDILPMAAIAEALRRIGHIESQSWIIEPVEGVKQEAERLLRRHPLRAADALQLAAACVLRAESSLLEFASEDERLATAAFREGFPLRRLRADA